MLLKFGFELSRFILANAVLFVVFLEVCACDTSFILDAVDPDTVYENKFFDFSTESLGIGILAEFG